MIVQGQCTIFKARALDLGVTCKLALYTAQADLNEATLLYTPVNEVSGLGYVAGGVILTATPVATAGVVAYTSFNNAVWPIADFICRGGLIYDYTTLMAVAVLDFGSDKVAISPFTVVFPLATATTAILRTA